MEIKKDIQVHNLRSPELKQGIESFSISLCKKCERLSTALYLVTNFLSDIEPMKYRLRALSLDLVRDASFVRHGTSSNEANVLEAIRANISDTLSLLELSFIAGLVSEMNFSILKREYSSLRDSIDIKRASRESRTDTILGDTFFGPSLSESAPKGLTLRNLRPESLERLAIRDGSTPVVGQRSDLNETTAFHPNISIGHSKGQSNIKMSDRKVTLELKKPSFVKSQILNIAREARSNRILKLIKDNREVSIKDITNHFPELSEKTIQRELVSFTELGVLKKSGERRWSRYSLV